MSAKLNVLENGHLLTSPERTYRIESVLGCGGFGITYLASSIIKVGNVSVRVKFAIKEHFLSSDCERDPDTNGIVYSTPAKDRVENSRKDFIAEAKRIQKAGVSQHNIIKVNEVFEDNNTAYYVMEYIEGESLRSWITKNGPMDAETMLLTMIPIIKAVEYLHSIRMTHLDIKPDNIMLSNEENGEMRPVLIDFGLSKHYDEEGQPTSTLNTQGCSDGYAPIEQYVGITTFSPKADVYALSATILYVLSGKNPSIATDIKHEEIKRSLAGKVPQQIIDAIVNGLQIQAENRVESASKLLELLNGETDQNDYDRNTIPITEKTSPIEKTIPIQPNPRPTIKITYKKIIGIVCGVIALVGIGIGIWKLMPKKETEHYEMLADGSKFYGTLDSENKPNGEGKLIKADGTVLIGNWDEGILNNGQLITSEYEYDGHIVMSKPSGYGTARYVDGKVYVGNWKNGEWNGLGKLIESTESISFGIFHNGVLTNPQPFKVGEKVYGIDVSRWQSHINWEELYLPANSDGEVVVEGGEYMQPSIFAIIKATDGKEEDPYFERNYQGIRKCGIAYGAYHFLTTKCTADEQVESFIKTSKLKAGDLPPVLDLELSNELMTEKRKEVCEIAIEWLEKIETHYGVRPIIYTYEYFIKDYLTDPKFDKYEYWIARHRKTPPESSNWRIWQFTDKARISGIDANTVDVDIFKGNYKEFEKFISNKGIK